MAEIGGCELEGEEEVEVLVGAEGETGDGEAGGGAFVEEGVGEGGCGGCVVGGGCNGGDGGRGDDRGDEEDDAGHESCDVLKRAGKTHRRLCLAWQ